VSGDAPRAPAGARRAAIASGLLLAAPFLAPVLAPLAWVALLPLLTVLEKRLDAGLPARALFGPGFLAGLACYLTGAYWLVQLSDVAITVPWLKYPGWVLSGAYLALYPAVAAWLAGVASRRSGLSLAVTFPCAWLVLEELRGAGELGFPWFQPGYSQVTLLPVVQLASLGSVTLVTAWVLGVNVLLWRAWRPRAPGTRARWALGAALVLAFPFAWGSAALRAAVKTPADAPHVALVQPDIAGEIKWDGKHQPEIMAKILDQSEHAAATRPRLIVWPETATGSYLTKQLDQALAVSEFASRHDTPVFAGFPDYRIGPRGEVIYENAAGMFLPGGARSDTYAKIHLVPFGERMPFESWLPFMKQLQLGQAEWEPGRRWTLFALDGRTFGTLICFESIYPGHARRLVHAGATWLVNITNDEWFGRSAALHQHAAMAVFRAVENRVPLARCANTGVTMMVDAYGHVTAQVPTWTPAIVDAALPAAGLRTPYTRLGDWPGLVAVLALIALLVARRRTATR
jgi:apolipoprotein N-acyltransferase